MPWELGKVKGGYKVKNQDTGKQSYSRKPQSKGKATAQMRAMYANSPEAVAKAKKKRKGRRSNPASGFMEMMKGGKKSKS